LPGSSTDLSLLVSAPVPRQGSLGSPDKKTITERGESDDEKEEEVDVEMENGSNEGEWIGLGDDSD
jgi:hypothetical protein